MKPLASILLAGYFFLGGLMPGMDFCELLKIPELALHFQEHKQADRELEFLKFIGSHYGDEQEEPADEHQLPFKDHHCCAGHTHTALVLPGMALQLTPMPFNEHLKDTYSCYFTSTSLNTIWQPPRFV